MRDPAARSDGGAFPPVDEHIVTPETTRDEVVRGRTIYAAPSLAEHGDPHFRLDVAIGTHVRPGYVGSTDLITRVADDGDFASDTCVRREGIDPATGHRYLEDLSFEVVNTQRLSDVTAKAEELAARGVRRVFAVFTRKGQVSEFIDGDWAPIPAGGAIDDVCLATPLPVDALLRAGALGAAAVRGLLARGEPELRRLLDEARAAGVSEGEARGATAARRKVLRLICETRRLLLNTDHVARIDACDDPATLDRWITRAAAATTTDAVFE